MRLNRYGIHAKKYLKEHLPIKYNRLILNSSLMDYLLQIQKYLYDYENIIRLYLKDTYPEPKTNEFIVMARYNNMIDSIVDEYVMKEIEEIV